MGLGLDRSTASAPDVQPLTPTDGRQFFHLTHTGLGHGDIFYLFLRVLSKAGLESQLTIGPLIIDVTPPDVTQPLTVVVEGDLLVTAWTHGMFTDSEQPRGVEFVYTFRVGEYAALFLCFDWIEWTRKQSTCIILPVLLFPSTF